MPKNDIEIGEYFSFDNPAFKVYVITCILLIMKMFFLSLLTGYQRKKNKILASPEDSSIFSNYKMESHPDVDRVKRAHRNDLENILPYFTAAFGYLMTGPSTYVAILLMVVFTLGRFVHTYVYAVNVIPQPARALAWAAGYIVTIYMAVTTAMHFY